MSTDFFPPNILPSWAPDLLPAWIQGWLGNDLTQVGVVAVFAIVYLGMFFGGLPHMRLDRTGVALLGAIAMIALTGMGLEQAARSVGLPKLVLHSCRLPTTWQWPGCRCC